MLKYKIKLILQAMEPSMKKRAKKKILENCAWSESTYTRNINARVYDNKTISADDLKTIAGVLLLPMEALFNETEKA